MIWQKQGCKPYRNFCMDARKYKPIEVTYKCYWQLDLRFYGQTQLFWIKNVTHKSLDFQAATHFCIFRHTFHVFHSGTNEYPMMQMCPSVTALFYLYEVLIWSISVIMIIKLRIGIKRLLFTLVSYWYLYTQPVLYSKS